MKQTRRNVLRKVSALSALTLGASGLVAAADCSGYPDWQSDVAYTDGDRVVYDGALWEAQWWTQANEPETSDSVWVKVGLCDGTAAVVTVATAGTATRLRPPRLPRTRFRPRRVRRPRSMPRGRPTRTGP